jgi:hypothetical protein
MAQLSPKKLETKGLTMKRVSKVARLIAEASPDSPIPRGHPLD